MSLGALSKDILPASILNFLVSSATLHCGYSYTKVLDPTITLHNPPPIPSARGSQEAPHLAGRDIESSCPQIHPLKRVNEGQEQNHARPLRGADPAQSKHDHPLIGGHNLFMRVRKGAKVLGRG